MDRGTDASVQARNPRPRPVRSTASPRSPGAFPLDGTASPLREDRTPPHPSAFPLERTAPLFAPTRPPARRTALLLAGSQPPGAPSPLAFSGIALLLVRPALPRTRTAALLAGGPPPDTPSALPLGGAAFPLVPSRFRSPPTAPPRTRAKLATRLVRLAPARSLVSPLVWSGSRARREAPRRAPDRARHRPRGARPLTRENRLAVCAAEAALGDDALEAAVALLALSLCNDAVSRAYYAAFHYARALLPCLHRGAVRRPRSRRDHGRPRRASSSRASCATIAHWPADAAWRNANASAESTSADAPIPSAWWTGSVDGSLCGVDGTRTRGLRRDRPAL